MTAFEEIREVPPARLVPVRLGADIRKMVYIVSVDRGPRPYPNLRLADRYVPKGSSDTIEASVVCARWTGCSGVKLPSHWRFG